MSNNLNKAKKKSFLDEAVKFSLLSILLGLLVGAIVLMISGRSPIVVYGAMIEGIIGKPNYVAWTIIKATPYILTGLSIAFAFKTGLFNIGAEGQFIVGALVATLVGVGVAFYFSYFMVSNSFISVANSESSVAINDSASIGISWMKGLVGPATSVNWGIVISIILVFVVWFILNKTTLGFELKAVGHNKDAAEYAGIDVSKSMLKSMAIAGILAGIAGAIQVMGVTHNITVLAAQEGYGFDGIAVALIANSNPIGVIFSGLLFGAFKYGGIKMQSVNAPSEVINIVIGSIVYFIALSNGLRILYQKMKEKRAKGGKA